MKLEPDIPEWDKTRSLLRQHFGEPKLKHPDFINSGVLEAIDRLDRKEIKRPFFPLHRLAWAGVFGLLAAAVLTGIFLPGELSSHGQGAFLSQVIDVRSDNPNVSISTFQSPDDRGVVLWVEGTDFIPANQPVL